MPELPEVETIARGLAKRVTGEVIESVWLGQKKEPLKSPTAEIATVLEHRRILEVRRMGKHIVFELNRVGRAISSGNGHKLKKAGGGARPASVPHAKAQWIVHLGMTGRLQVCDPQTEIPKHTHAILKLSSGREL